VKWQTFRFMWSSTFELVMLFFFIILQCLFRFRMKIPRDTKCLEMRGWAWRESVSDKVH